MDTHANWGPAQKAVPDLLDHLMCMHTVDHEGTPITSYKHNETRRYINLDATGAAYDLQFSGGSHTATKISLADAKAHLLS